MMIHFDTSTHQSMNIAMVDPSYSGFLGLRSRHQHHACRAEDQDEAMSIISVATSKNFYCDDTNKSNKKHSSAVSVMSDISSSSTALEGDPNNPDTDDFAGTHEFVIKCKNHEMVFVSSPQGRMIKARCRHFRLLLATGNGGHVVIKKGASQQDSQEEEDNRILKKETWTAGTARHVIELLTEGTTWIDNDQRRFTQLAKACEEIDVRLCLGSLINYHDLVDQESTRRFFKLIKIDNFQLKLKAVIQSWQWLHLLHKGILLLANTKVLMITVAPPTDGTGKLPTSSKSTKIVSKVAPSVPNQQRLAKCDALCSEFCVYSHHTSKINALLTILELLQKSKDASAPAKEAASTKRKKTPIQPEQFKVTYKTLIGSIKEDDLNMLWRLTSASYTLATNDEKQYLSSDVATSNMIVKHGSTHSAHTAETLPTNGGSDHQEDHSETSITSDEGSPVVSPKRQTIARPILPSPPLPMPTYQYRTITGTSCMVLKSLFDPLNVGQEQMRSCISVTNPTPDTLGRFLNAAASQSGVCGSIKVGWDIVSINQTVFYVTADSLSIKEVLLYLSNYENSAVVDKNMRDFLLQQFVGGTGN
jgi:hypothetical protein